MSEYFFTEDANACVILTPAPPRHWYNYLWNEDRYCSQISQMGHGRSYYLSEKAEMCQINSGSARYVYLRDDEAGFAWNIGRGPLNTEVENYRCTHAIGYTQIESDCQGIHGAWRIFVPVKGHHEIWTLTLQNKSRQSRRLSVFSAVSFTLEGFSYPRYYEMYRCITTRFEPRLNGIYCDSAHPFAPHGLYHSFLASSEPVTAWDGDLTKFCGPSNTLTLPDASVEALFQRPDIVMNGQDCTGSEGALFIPGGVLQNKITLQPGEEKIIQLMFGISASLEQACTVAADCRNMRAVEEKFAEAQQAYLQKYRTLTVRTPDEKINALMNNWVKKQVDFCIVGKKGVRDNLQIAAALLDYRQQTALEEILECLRHQFRDGHAVLTWYPYDATRYSDQPFWIIWAVCRLIKETGDFSFLQRSAEWQDGGSGTVLAHLKAAVDRLLADKGRHGLIRIFFADWNDALNITTDDEAESVMLSHQFCLALKELAVLMSRAGDPDYAAFLEREYQTLKDAINANAWDGKWYARALSRDETIGSKNSRGSKIYLNAQTWAVLAGVADKDRLPAVLDAVDGMEQDFGFPLNLPPYTEYSPHVGRMSGMLPGLFENGGVYCHATGFKILMDCKAGRGAKAVETLKKIMPDSEANPSMRSGAEPFVFTNCYSTHPGYYGKSYQSWTTGTSAWCLMGLYEGILGVKADYDGLRIEPSMPDCWPEAEMTRHFRGADYHIVFHNLGRHGKTAPQIFADGQLLPANILPDFQDGRLHEVSVMFS